jgi:hypothetical protein
MEICSCIIGGGEGDLTRFCTIDEGGGGEGALIDSDDGGEGDFDTCNESDLIDFSLVFEEDDDTESSFSGYGIETLIFKLIIGLNR